MSALIRRADERDLMKILRIEKECFSDPWSINIFRSALSEPHARIFVLEDAEGIAGYSVSTVVLDEGSLDNLAVTAAKRGHGYGRILLQNALKDAQNGGIKRFFLEVRESNERAVRLYEKAGFTRIGVRKAYYQDPVEDAVIMEFTC
ncbi:MAG: ribosomal protein S18-alanine N-acetyltransferase [Lachnospiraceae bacterium]|nr:ribosomal protein S18-alanine N-acetyltransferase [Lachnospiraceae bacterium]